MITHKEHNSILISLLTSLEKIRAFIKINQTLKGIIVSQTLLSPDLHKVDVILCIPSSSLATTPTQPVEQNISFSILHLLHYLLKENIVFERESKKSI